MSVFLTGSTHEVKAYYQVDDIEVVDGLLIFNRSVKHNQARQEHEGPAGKKIKQSFELVRLPTYL